MDFIKNNVTSYQIEEKLLKLSNKDKLTSEEYASLYEEVVDMCFDNYFGNITPSATLKESCK